MLFLSLSSLGLNILASFHAVVTTRGLSNELGRISRNDARCHCRKALRTLNMVDADVFTCKMSLSGTVGC